MPFVQAGLMPAGAFALIAPTGPTAARQTAAHPMTMEQRTSVLRTRPSIVRFMADSELAAPWTTLSPAQRETFQAAIERHRRASWRVTIACAVAVVAVALVVAILM